MIERPSTVRRLIVSSILAFLAAPRMPAVAGHAVGQEHRMVDEKLTARVCLMFAHPESASEIGRAYIAQRDESSLSGLLEEIFGRSWVPSCSDVADQAKDVLCRGLRQQVEEELSRANVLRVGGWLLTPTEARLCAVVHLAKESA